VERAEAEAIDDQGREVVVALLLRMDEQIQRLEERLAKQEERIAQLERRLARSLETRRSRPARTRPARRLGAGRILGSQAGRLAGSCMK
jgi:hypothetical protein